MLGGIDPAECKLHCATENDDGEQPLDVFKDSWDAWVGWNRWRPKNDAFNRRYIVSLMQAYPQSDMWIFGGMFEVMGGSGVPGANGYDVELIDHPIQMGIGRMKVNLRITARQRRRDLETLLGIMTVVETLTGLDRGQNTEASESSTGRYELEGNTAAARLHRSRERNRKLVADKKDHVMRRFGRLACEVCSYDFAAEWTDGLGRDFIECHHLVHLAQSGEREPSLRDLAVVCANCHRMFHCVPSGTTVIELQAQLHSTKHYQSAQED